MQRKDSGTFDVPTDMPRMVLKAGGWKREHKYSRKQDVSDEKTAQRKVAGLEVLQPEPPVREVAAGFASPEKAQMSQDDDGRSSAQYSNLASTVND